MDRNEAIKLLKDTNLFLRCSLAGDIRIVQAMNMAIAALEGKDTNVPTAWIPVSERLPEEDGIYLVSGGGRVWSAQCLTFGCIRGWSNDARNPAVSAWMPLPEPYQAERGEESE